MPIQSSLANREKGLCLLSLDAGGSRSISQIAILIQLMHRLNYDRDEDQMRRPCDVFDMIGGVGSGGFIAILLALLGLTVEEALQEFIELSVDVLDKRGTDAVARTAALRDHVVNLTIKYQFDPERKLLDSNERSKGCKLVVPISYKSHVGAICVLRNYLVREEQTLNLTIAEALMATLATPPQFTSTRVLKDAAVFEYIGADWTLANPIQELIVEAHGAFGAEKKVACLLSLGCGHRGVFAAPETPGLTEWSRFLERLAMDGERKAQSHESQMGKLGLYHRLSVSSGLEKGVKAQNLDPGEIISHTNVYLDEASVSQKMNLCVESIDIRDGASSLEQLRYSGGQVFLSPLLPPLTRTFVMRKEPWDFIHRVLLESRIGEDIDGPTMLIVTGIGGCGKTQLMLKFMKSYQSQFPNQFFIDGSSKDRIRADILRNVRALGTEHSQKTFEDCIIYLSQPSSGHTRLLLYDNVDDPDLDLSSLLPHGKSCAIAITSRNSLLGDIYPEAHLRLDIMSIDEAVDLLLQVPGHSTAVTERARVEATKIAEALGCLPVALQQARSYMQQTKCSPSAYLQRLSTNRHKLLGRAIKHQLDAQAVSTYAAFETSFDKLSVKSQMFMRLLSHFHWTAFPLELVTLAAENSFSDYEVERAEYGDAFNDGKQILESIFLLDGEWDITNLDEMTLALQSYSLSTISSHRNIPLLQMHPLVHEWVRSCIPERERQGYQSAAIVLLALGSRDEHPVTSQYLPSHVLHMSPLWDRLDVNEAVAFGYILSENGLHGHALQIREKVVEDLRRRVNSDDINLSKSISDLAESYRAAGKLDDAIPLQEAVLKLAQKTFGERHPHTIEASFNLSRSYQDMGRMAEAETLQVAVVSLQREILGDRHPNTRVSLNSLGGTYLELGKFNEAERIFEEVLKLDKEILGEKHRDTFSVSSNLALLYQLLGKPEEASQLQEELLKSMKEVLGERHPNTLMALGNLIISYSDLGRLDEAIVLQKELTKQRDLVLGPHHPDTMKSSNNLAILYLKMGRIKESEGLCVSTLQKSRELLGKEHPITMSVAKVLALAYHDSGKLNMAKELQEKVLIQRKEIQGERHPDTIGDSCVLGLIYQSLGRLDDAAEILEDALNLSNDIFGDEHPDSATMMVILALTFPSLRRWSDAETLLTKSLSIMKEAYGDRDLDTIEAISGLASILRLLKRLDEAEPLAIESQSLSTEIAGTRHSITLMASHELAAVLHDLGRLEEAQTLQEKTFGTIKEELGEHHFKTTKVMLLLARIYASQRREREALDILTSVEPIISEMLGMSHPQYLECQEIKAELLRIEQLETIPQGREVPPGEQPEGSKLQ